MINKPPISVIVPNYNHAKFLKQRLESVFNQTYQDFEVILLDDCSTDDSVDILNSYEDHPKVSQLIINKENSGSPFLQWKKGIELAQYDYLWIAESDDYCDLDFLEILVDSFNDRTVVLAYCASTIIDDAGIQQGRHKWADSLHPKRWESNFKNTGENELKHFLRYRNTITNASAVIFKKEAVKNIRYPIEMKFCGDWYFWIEILKQGTVVYKKQQLNFFRRHSATTKFVKPFELEKQRFKEYLKIIRFNSTFLSRVLNYKKYLWVLKEWNTKKKYFPENAVKQIGLPLEFIIYRRLKEIKNIF
jgi:glycosyltransferase involved in cell wall biosynthesis